MRCLLLLLVTACSSPPPPTIPPSIGPPPPGALSCFPPYSKVANKRFVLADLDQGSSCEVFIEQDECILGIFEDCTDPSPTPRQWVGRIDSTGMRDSLRFDIIEGVGGIVPRPPKCCDGEITEDGWAVLECALGSCDNSVDTAHVGAYIELAAEPATPWGASAGTGLVSGVAGAAGFVFVSGRQEIWVLTQTAVVVHEIGGAAVTLPIPLTAGRHIVLADHQGTAYIADGNRLHRIETASRTVSETIDLGAEVQVLALGPAGALVGIREGTGTELSLRAAGNLSTVMVTQPFPDPLSDVVAIAGGNNVTAWAAAVDGDHLLVLTSSLSVSRDRTLIKPATKLFAPAALFVGYFAQCSDLSNMEHCYFELDLAREETRRIGIPDVGRLSDAAVTADGTQMLFVGTEAQLGVLDRARFRPMVRERVSLTDGAYLALDETNGDAVILSSVGTFERIRPRR